MGRILTTTFTVEGTGIFPMDMLRYDRCSPLNTEDVLALTRFIEPDSHTGEEMLARRQPRRVALVTNHNTPTKARWASFGWNVIESYSR